MAWLAITWAGFVASILAAAFFWVVRSFGWTRFNPSVQVGCVVSRDPGRPMTETLGFLLLILLGSTAVPALYAALFAFRGGASWVAGAAAGGIFGLLTAAALPLLGTISACVRSGVIPAPGAFGIVWGRLTPAAVVAATLIHGGITGAILAGFGPTT